jgi:hypothetical protein
MEAGYSHGIIAMDYLETGNYQSLLRLSENAQFDEFLYRELRDFYLSLDDGQKFEIIGVDLETFHFSNDFKYAVGLLFVDSLKPDNLTELLDDFENSAISDYDEIKNNFYLLNSDFNYNEHVYREALKENFPKYAELLDRTSRSLKFEYYNYNFGKDSTMQTKRENYMYRNFRSVLRRYPNDKFFAQFGLAHIGLNHFLALNENLGIQSFTAKLNQRQASGFTDSICSIATLYFSKFNNQQKKPLYLYGRWLYKRSLRHFLPKDLYKSIEQNTQEDALYLLRLNNPESPFKSIAENNFQYLIFVR